MLFHSIDFFIFFPFILIGHYALKKSQLRIFFLLVISYVFYMWNSPLNGIYLAISTLVTFFVGLKIPNSKNKKIVIIIGLLFNFGLLFFFKGYEPFYPALKVLFPKLQYHKFSLPLGLSFYTFQAIAYIVDIYKNDFLPETSFINFALFHSFFPQLMAGPIERAHKLLPQIKQNPILRYEIFRKGSLIFTFGLMKKLVIADRLAFINERILLILPKISSIGIILGGYPNIFHYYYDFSSYSDMARGIALMMGINLSINFNYPFLADSPIEAWRRSHITFMSWLHDYIFVPLVGLNFTFINIISSTLVVFIISGAWHSLKLNYILWGLINGIAVCLNIIFRRFFKFKANKIIKVIKVIGTFHFFVISGLLAAFEDVPLAFSVLKKIFVFPNLQLKILISSIPIFDLTFIVIIVFILMICEIIYSRINFWNNFDKWPIVLRWISYTILIFVLILFSFETSRTYVYFKF